MVVAAVLTSAGVVTAIRVAVGSKTIFFTDTLCLRVASVAVIVITLLPAVRVTGTVVVKTPPAPTVAATGVPLTVTVTV